jgi:subtilisin-like proprotein convertase family protein
MKTTLFATLTLVLTGAAHAATTITETFTNSTGSTIPDGDLSGLVQTINPATTIGTIDSITVTFNVTGGWVGDLYAYLWHDGIISILLNRPGRTSSDLAGSPASGLSSVTLADDASTDIHAASAIFGSPLTGNYQPDGRAIHPNTVLDTTPRTAGLSVFNNAPAPGEYRIFIADVATGDTATLVNWSISITGEAIPEPTSTLLLAIGSLALLQRRRKSQTPPRTISRIAP